jgi:dihydrodipicolinate synthase/N-acetylneuraminate lyase
VFVDEMAHLDARPMVGIISLSLRTIIGRIERAMAMGVRVFQVSLPSWGALSDAEVAVFFREVCGRFPEAQFLHYNLPRAGRLLTARQYAALAAAHPNLVATKYGGGDVRVIAELLTIVPQLRHFLTELGFAAGSLIGAPGYLISFGGSNPRRAQAYFAAALAHDAATLGAMQAELMGLHQELVAAMGAAPHGPHMDGAYDKLFSKLHDPRFPLRLLPPYLGATEAVFDRYRAALQARFPQWLPAASHQ